MLIYALALALALSLTACGQPNAEQPTDPAPSTSAPEPIATPEPIKDTTPKTTEDAQSPEDGQALEELNHDELIAIFEENYEISKSIYNSDDEEVIRSELEMIKIIVKSMDKSLPSDYEAQYRVWRPSVNQQTQQAPELTLTFTDCNETVYATGTVNLRSGPSTNDEKVGALNKNQSVTRIGIGTGDYASWSKVKLSDGSEVYVASKYLTTTKPVSQSSSKPSGGTSSTGGSQQPAGSSQGSNHAHSAEDDDPILSQLLGGNSEAWDPLEGMTPEEREAQMEADRKTTQEIVDGITGSFG
ncbi:SH3 domain-containing protein [Oscillospiraceae bacterium 44-34]